jgi:membrane protease YdiL (CAAX protease family)
VDRQEGLIARHPVAAYFALTFGLSWTGAFAISAPHLARHRPLPQVSGMLMFPLMLLGPCVAGIALTKLVDGKSGLEDLFSRMLCFRFPTRWYLALLFSPLLVLTVLVLMQRWLSPVYAPNRFFLGILFAVPPGLLEEIGWTGYVFPKMHSRSSALAASVTLGLIWALWHLPVINYLSAVTPLGRYWLRFFVAFAWAMVAMRVLISWLYTNTKSVLLAQLVHISSTGSLIVFGPAHTTAAQEPYWYAIYGTALWVLVAVVAHCFGKQLQLASAPDNCF